jgi:hypothetical protein
MIKFRVARSPLVNNAWRSLRAADPLYIWSALIGAVLAGILIGLAQILASRALR